MRVAWGRARLVADLGSPPGRPAVAIGNFDGVHRGHQALVAAARTEADSRGAQAGVLTFDPHPARFFAPALAPPLLLPLARRLELLGEAGADFALVEPFDAQLAAMDPERFVAEFLVGSLGVGHVVVGYDFSFGRKREGNAARLTELGARHGFGVTVVAPVTADGLTCSSTKIREFLLEGRIEGAALLLGRPPEISGEVVRGASRGRGLGFATANLRPDLELVPFRSGIYAARAVLLDRVGATHPAAVSIGTNPTFDGQLGAGSAPLTVEAHLLDYPGADLYGERLRLLFVSRLRDERRFDRVEDLIAEIGRDVQRTRQLVF
jgi:riboflavin kinase/FMN adenylyltransferase